MSVHTDRPITRADIEGKLREIQGSAEAGREATKGAGMIAGIAGVGVLVLGAYLLGRRKGRKRRTVVEIKRI